MGTIESGDPNPEEPTYIGTDFESIIPYNESASTSSSFFTNTAPGFLARNSWNVIDAKTMIQYYYDAYIPRYHEHGRNYWIQTYILPRVSNSLPAQYAHFAEASFIAFMVDGIQTYKPEVFQFLAENGFSAEALAFVKEEPCPDGKVKHPLTGQCITLNSINPVEVDCVGSSVSIANNISSIRNNPGLNSEVNELKNNIGTNTNEKGMSIEKLSNGSLQPYNVHTGTSQQTNVSTSADNKVLIGGIHTHPPNQQSGPSPADIYHLIQGNINNINYETDFIFAADGTEYAIVIEDRNKAMTFNSTYPSNLYLNGNNFSGSPEDGPKSINGDFYGIMNLLYNSGYKKPYEYALVTFLKKYDIGISLFVKDKNESSYKKLSLNIATDNNGKITNFEINKCK